MIELGKYDLHILSAYSVTIGILLLLGIQTLIDFIKTKNKLAKYYKKVFKK